MDRLAMIYQIDPLWASAIEEFIVLNPEFQPYLPYAALNQYPEIPSELKTIKDMLLYYVCYAGVNTNYGGQAWSWVKTNQLSKLTVKKRSIIDNILAQSEIKTIDEFNSIKIKGVGEGAMTFVRQNYFKDVNIIYPTDRIFQKGLCKIYEFKNVTVSQAKNKAQSWKGQKSVGSMFCFQAGNYGDLIKIATHKSETKLSHSKIKIELKSKPKIAIKLKSA